MTALTLFKYVLAIGLGWVLAPIIIIAAIALLIFTSAFILAFFKTKPWKRS